MPEYHSVSVRNNWESLEYTCNGEPILYCEDFTAVVKYPDGTHIGDAFIRAIAYTKAYSDQGHTYHAKGYKYVIIEEFHGIEIRIPLEQVEIDLNTIEFPEVVKVEPVSHPTLSELRAEVKQAEQALAKFEADHE